jgi:N-acetylneuraminic acid mutarotase
MIVWGGLVDKSNARPSNTGGIYDPQTNTWEPMTTIFAPEVRQYHTAVWTGSRMIVWGGASASSTLITGGIYDPQTDTWAPTSTVGAPELYYWHTAVWTGAEMIVWGGIDQVTGEEFNTGGIYDPQTDSWRPTSTVDAPTGRFAHTAVWTGAEMIVWGGLDETSTVTHTGGVYDPATDTWAATPTAPPYEGRHWHSAVWTGAEMIIWGGTGWFLDTGDIYYPQSDTWALMSTANAPQGRGHHCAVWTGTEMIVWGGTVQIDLLTNTGGVYTLP